MSLEQFKTQILLLHSEQSTLDNLSTGFNDRYTVHCATSGSEALNTLGETAIDVIVTAQDLPGMSGLDALREAKKRSPDTIGILLAGNDGEGVEALVGDQEVFQIIRGGVTPETLKGVIDNATRQSRLMALAESANDTAANMDESAEHIVMETSENGSTIISDGTGRLPVLNPDKVSPEANVGARAVDVLVLTKDEEFLTTVRESAQGMHNVIYANTLAQADEAVKNNRIGVAVVDAAMVGDNVEKLTLHLRTTARRLVSIVAGRRDDGEMLMDLINRGKVYRFLLKPVSPGRARLAIEASVKHHLEAPDAAFKTVGSPAPARPAPVKAQPKPAPKPAPKSKPAPAPEPKQAAKPARKAEAPKSGPEIRVEPRISTGSDDSTLIEDSLGDAFGGDDSSFAETMTGIVRTVGDSISSVTGRKDAEPDEATPAAFAESGDSMSGKPMLLATSAVVVIAAFGAGWWFLGGSDDPASTVTPQEQAPQFAETEPVVEEPQAPVRDSRTEQLLEEARLAAAAGQIFNPPGSNAVELYLAAAAAAPADETIAAELGDVVDQTLAMAETALLERRPEDAAAALNRIEMADAGNARLPFLTAQLSQLQLRDFLDTSRSAIRDGRYEDAAVALDGARALNVEDGSEIELVAAELSDALSAQRVDDVLARANARLEEGKLTAPSNDNARYYYELALSNDPGNTAARQGLTVIASKLVLQARDEIDAGQFDAADIILADARRLDPTSGELAATTSALQAARQRVAEQKRIAAERAAAEKAAAERAKAERIAAEKAAAEKAEAERIAAEKAAAEKLAAEQAAAERQAAEQLAAEQLAAEQAAAQANAAVDSGGATGDDAAPTRVEPAPIPVSSLERTKYVAPKYPRTAQRRGVSGWVDVVFTVDIDGTVTNVAVRDSKPGTTFVNSAVTAIEGWQFEPVIENGNAVQKRAAVRMLFAIE